MNPKLSLRELLEATIERLESDLVTDEEVDRLRETLRAALAGALAEHAHAADAEARSGISMSSRSSASSTRFAAEAGVEAARSAIGRTIAAPEPEQPGLTFAEQAELDDSIAPYRHHHRAAAEARRAADEWRLLASKGYMSQRTLHSYVAANLARWAERTPADA